jgi:ClpP class serine protease
MHPHSLYRLASRVHNTPHLIVPDEFHFILNYLDARNSPLFAPTSVPLDDDNQESMDDDVDPGPSPLDDDTNQIPVVSVDGTLTYKPVMSMCGEVGTSYQALVETFEELAEAGHKLIVMEVSSGGGEASHCFQAANDIRAICDDNNIQLIGYADTMACSAAYALICVCDVVIANPSASLGSIGCVVSLLDTSKAMEQAGLKRIFITSGENKVPFDADGSFKESFLEEIQADVDRLNDEFTAHVAANTGIDAKIIRSFEAGVFDAETAVQKGLANAVMTNKQFAAYVASLQGNQ